MGFLVAVGDSAVAVLVVGMAGVAVHMAAVADEDNEAISRCAIWQEADAVVPQVDL